MNDTRNWRYLFVALTLLTTVMIRSVLADGFIVIPDHPRLPHPATPFPLEVVYHRVQVEIDNQLATTSVDQAFRNPTSRQLEGFYLFPVPKNAAIKKFSMQVNGRETPAELLDAKKARKLYEDIVRESRDPALMEYSEQSLYKVRIFPIEPHSEKKVTLSYQEILGKDGNTHEYLYPLNTEKFSAKPLKNVSIKVGIAAEEPLKNVLCPTHEVDVVRKGEKRVVVSYEERDIKPDIDFRLYFDTSPSKVGLSLLSHRQSGDGYFFLSATPALDYDESEISEKDITFVLDVSGSMAGDKLKQAKHALRYCIASLNDGDRFEVVRFSTEANALFKQLALATDANRKKAQEYVAELRAIGGTNIEEALQFALSVRKGDKRPTMIVFMTDGKPTIGQTDEDKLVQSVKDANDTHTRVFTFGIGDEINTHLLDKITEVTRAARSYISPSEDIEVKVSQFYDKVRSPVLTDVSISYGDIEVDQTHPRELPDLFRGSNLTVLGRYEGHGKTTVVLTGDANGKARSYRLETRFADDSDRHEFIPMLWASRRVGYLLDLIRLHGEDKELVDEVTQLARTHGIVTPYTSYLIMEDESVRVARSEIREDFQTFGRLGESNRELRRRNSVEYDGLRQKSGEASVQASKEFQALNQAYNVAQAQQGSGRLNYHDAYGIEQNLAQQTKNVMGRAVYQSGKFWVDSELQNTKHQQSVRIQFASEEYFDLYRNNTKAAQFLALGQNVRFHLDGTYYEVYE